MKNLIKAAALGVAVATTSFVAPSITLAAGFDVNATTTGLALRGYDPVSYFNGGPELGSFKITSVYPSTLASKPPTGRSSVLKSKPG